MSTGRTKILTQITIIKHADAYFGVFDRSLNEFRDELLGRYVIVRLRLGNGNELAVRGRITLTNEYIPPRLKVIFPRRLSPTLEKLHGMRINTIIEYEEGEENRISTSG